MWGVGGSWGGAGGRTHLCLTLHSNPGSGEEQGGTGEEVKHSPVLPQPPMSVCRSVAKLGLESLEMTISTLSGR